MSNVSVRTGKCELDIYPNTVEILVVGQQCVAELPRRYNFGLKRRRHKYRTRSSGERGFRSRRRKPTPPPAYKAGAPTKTRAALREQAKVDNATEHGKIGKGAAAL